MMKKTFLLATCFLSLGTQAQLIPNRGFENWTIQNNVEDPDGWITLNMLSFFGVPPTAIKSTDAHQGSFAIKLETVEFDIDQDGVGDTIPSTIILGQIDAISGETSDGMPINEKPDSLVGWFKFNPFGGDAFSVSVSVSKWNIAEGQRDLIGYGDIEIGETIQNYTRIAIPIEYYTADMPDTVVIQATNAISTTTPGTALFIDQLSFESMNVADVKTPQLSYVRCYPNPAHDKMIIQLPDAQNFSIYNALGEKMHECRSKSSGEYLLDTAQYKNGVYVIRTESGKTIRFVVQH